MSRTKEAVHLEIVWRETLVGWDVSIGMDVMRYLPMGGVEGVSSVNVLIMCLVDNLVRNLRIVIQTHPVHALITSVGREKINRSEVNSLIYPINYLFFKRFSF